MRPRTLADFQGECRPSGQQLNFRVCPVCGSESWKLYLNPETGFWFCHAGAHQGGGAVEIGTLSQASLEGKAILQMLNPAARVPDPPTAEVDLPEWEPLSDRARRYLHRRGLSDESIARWGLVEWVDQYRVLIPYFSQSGQLVYYNSRRYSDNLGDGPKYKGMPGRHPLYVPDRRGRGKVVVVEGAFDAMAVRERTPYHVVALGGKSLPKYLRTPLRDEVFSAILLKDGGEVVICLDGDAIGDSLQLLNKIPPLRGITVRMAVLENGEDPASITPERLREVLDA